MSIFIRRVATTDLQIYYNIPVIKSKGQGKYFLNEFILLYLHQFLLSLIRKNVFFGKKRHL